MEPLQNGNETTSPLQRIAIGAGALIVVILTVVAAIFLAMQDLPQDSEPTPIVGVSPTTAATNTPVPSPATPTLTPTPVPPPTDTPIIPTLGPTDTPVPPPTQPPPTATGIPEPASPTFTPLPAPPTLTPTPAVVTNCGSPPPSGWVAYVVQTTDTFGSLAGRTDTSVFNLQEANCLRAIKEGDTIYLPFNPPPPTATSTRHPTPRSGGTTPTRTSTPISPIINNVVPDRVDEQENGEGYIITILGKNFRSDTAGFTVELRGPQNLKLHIQGIGSDTSFDVIVPPDLPAGIYDVVITNPNNRAGVKESAFIIGEAPPTATAAPRPTITDVVPDEGANDQDHIIEVKGTNFKPDDPGDFRVELRIGQDLKAELELVGTASSTSVKATVPTGLAAGVYDLWVINPDGQDDVEPAAYESKEP